MKLSIPIIVLFLLVGAAAAQLSSDRERFDIELHPGEVEEKILTLTNTGDTSILEISKTSIGGSAQDLIYLDMPEPKVLAPQDKEEIKIFFAIPPEIKPGSYIGFMYLIDSSPPSMPLVVEFHIEVVKQESYGLSLSINDAKAATEIAKSDEPAEMDVVVRNMGQFRDVASINSSSLLPGWSISLIEGDAEVDLPYDLPLGPGASHQMKLEISPANPGEKGPVIITATSMGDKSKNSTAYAFVRFGIAVRKYKANVEVPEKLVVNRTYNCAFGIELDVDEDIKVGVFTPPELMVVPSTQVVSVSPEKAGKANFTILASKPGNYPILFKAVDSNGIPLPGEMAMVMAMEPEGTAILTADSFLYKTMASLAYADNRSIPMILISADGLSERDRESLLSYSQVVILGNKSVVSMQAEKSLADVSNVMRIEGEDIGETSWRFISEMWKNGTVGVVISSPKDIDIFRAYQEAKTLNFPIVICDSPMSSASRSIIAELSKRKARFSKAIIVGKISEDTIKTLKEMGISIEEVAH
jgi:putative cell wall-binding protein